MSRVISRPLPVTRPRVDVVGDWQGAAIGGGLVLVAGWLAHRWWTGPTPVPLSWAAPSAQALLLLPTVMVVGLLALRLALAGHRPTPTSGRLMVLAARWAAVAAVVTTGWLLTTAVDLYGGAGRLASADNLVVVLSADDAATGQLVLVQLMVLVAMFGTRLEGRLESAGLLVLTAAALVAAFPFAPAGHGHEAAEIPAVVPAVAGLQVLGLAVWLGVLLALPCLRGRGHRSRQWLAGAGTLLSGGVAGVGAVSVLAGLARPELPTPLVVEATGLVAVAVVAHAGRAQRARVLDVAVVRGGPAWAGLVATEVVAMSAVVLLSCWLPTSG